MGEDLLFTQLASQACRSLGIQVLPDLCDAVGRQLVAIFDGVVPTADMGLIGETAYRAAVACMISLFSLCRG